MGLILDIKAGPFAGQKIEVPPGQPFSVGRAPNRSNFAIPQDTYLSGLHFVIEHGPQGCRIIDQRSSNGTYLNGAKIVEAQLRNGDEVRAGQTIFTVRIVSDERVSMRQPPPAPTPPVARPQPSPPPSAPMPNAPRQTEGLPAPIQQPPIMSKPVVSEIPMPMVAPRIEPAAPRPVPSPQRPLTPTRPAQPAILTIGSWKFSTLPPGWQVKEEFGMERSENGCFPSSVVATEEVLGAGVPLQQFVESQVSMLRQYLREPSIEAAVPPAIEGADERVFMNIHYKTKDGQALVYSRLYARTARMVGTITLTSLESDLPETRLAFDAILSGARFIPQNS